MVGFSFTTITTVHQPRVHLNRDDQAEKVKQAIHKSAQHQTLSEVCNTASHISDLIDGALVFATLGSVLFSKSKLLLPCVLGFSGVLTRIAADKFREMEVDYSQSAEDYFDRAVKLKMATWYQGFFTEGAVKKWMNF